MSGQTFTIKFVGNYQQINASIKEIQSNITVLKSSISGTLANWASGLSGFKTGIGLLTKGFGYIKQPFEDAMQFENISTRMVPMLGGIEKTRALLKDIRLQSANVCRVV